MPAAERRELIVSTATDVFAARGYDGASIDEIARRAGVSAPVVYDHFASKQDLYERLLERTRDELLDVWRDHLFTDEPAAVRIPRAIEAWAGYVEAHLPAARMYFRDPTGVPAVQDFHREIHAQGRAALGTILGREQGAEHIAGSDDAEALEMAAEVMRAGLAGLAVWWSDHPHVPRERIVTTAVNVLWVGFERVRSQSSAGGDGDAGERQRQP
jgi:AcrR family transcriptional regulator